MATTAATEKKRARPKQLLEATPPQTVSYTVGAGDELSRGLPSGVTYQTYRDLALDPTIALARSVIAGAVLAGAWSVDADEDVPDEVVEAVRKCFLPKRNDVMQAAVLGSIDYGWVGFEKVWEEEGGGRLDLVKLKPLLVDLTTILVERTTGAFVGYKQRPWLTGQELVLYQDKCLHIGFRIEGTQWHGKPLLENARRVCTKWSDCDAGASRYDKKIAGSHWVIYYPPGVSLLNGTETDNGQVAAQLLRSLEASGCLAIPRTVLNIVENLNAQAVTAAGVGDLLAWKVELLSDSGGRQALFIDRLNYLDKLKVRALLLPERSILEGQFGTKAEAGAHGDVALLQCQLLDHYITDHINEDAVDQFLALNYGERMCGKVRLSSAPLVDEQRAFLQEVFKAILISPQGFMEEFGNIDTDSLKDRLGVPKAKEVAQAGEEDEGVQAPAGLTDEELAKLSGVTIGAKRPPDLARRDSEGDDGNGGS